jgi:hypothetical protein
MSAGSAVYTELKFCYALQEMLFLCNVVWDTILPFLLLHTKPAPPPPTIHFMTSFLIQKALKLCPSALTPNNLV